MVCIDTTDWCRCKNYYFKCLLIAAMFAAIFYWLLWGILCTAASPTDSPTKASIPAPTSSPIYMYHVDGNWEKI